ncbi:universal stress protein [Marinobacterium jannaschii]|uniref:universal stress protein n=1 Tax=Marinobacterium jannaschii TaxID=64970 RepID=UPI0004840A8C|nr:universal stress protein [Marinobacterium jannaschii]
MFQNILLPVDLSHLQQQDRLLDTARTICGGLDARLHLLFVDQSRIHQAGSPHMDSSLMQRHREDALQRLEAIKAQLKSPQFSAQVHVTQGVAHDQILEVAERLNCDAIVMMARKPGVSSYFIGSNAERVVRHAACSVFVVRD